MEKEENQKNTDINQISEEKNSGTEEDLEGKK